MVVRRRWRAVVFPLLLYVVSGGVTSYFVWHAINGHRGLKAQDEYQAKIQAMNGELKDLQAERGKWMHKVEMMRSAAVDADLLDEEARDMLGRVHKNELVVLLPPEERN